MGFRAPRGKLETKHHPRLQLWAQEGGTCLPTKGRVGKGARKGGRIRKVGSAPDPMDQFVERKAAHEASGEATDTGLRRDKRQQG